MRRIAVPVDPPYDVVVAPHALRELRRLLASRRRVAFVSQAAVAEHHAAAARAGLDNSELFLIGGGEPAKTLGSVERLGRELAAWGLLRDDLVVALGGGVVGDVAGFTAAVYYRGIDVVQVEEFPVGSRRRLRLELVGFEVLLQALVAQDVRPGRDELVDDFGAGRLIRTETDRGVLMIGDPRLIDKPYGRRIWTSLPPMRRTRELSDVEAFFSRR